MAATTLTPGDIAIIGYVNNSSPDAFSFITLTDLGSGTVIYFTDNSWSGSTFAGVSGNDRNGNENLARITINAGTIGSGTIIRSNDTSSDFTWATITDQIDPSLAISANNRYENLSLSQSGEQITALQSNTSNNPLSSNTPIYQIDNSGNNTPITGLSPINNTAFLLPTSATSGTTSGASTQISGRYNFSTPFNATKADLLAAIGSQNNWQFNNTSTTADLPSSYGGNNIVNPVPEPITMFGSLTALVVGAGLKQFRKRFQA